MFCFWVRIVFLLVIKALHTLSNLPPYVNFNNELNLIQQNQKIFSSIVIKEQNLVPDVSRWAVCDRCALSSDRFVLFMSKKSHRNKNAQIFLSSSTWSEFFYKKNDIYLLKYLTKEEFYPRYIINRPVFIVPLLTVHVGHWLIDLIESIYHAMMDKYGKVRRDALIVIDVANPEEIEVLEKAISQGLYGTDDDVDLISVSLQLLFAFTELRVVSANEFFSKLVPSLPSGVIFEHLHVGLDTSKSFYYRGYRYHPHIIGSDVWKADAELENKISLYISQQWHRIAGPHRSFQRYIEQYLVPLIMNDDLAKDNFGNTTYIADSLLVLRKDSKRSITNFEDLKQVLLYDFEYVLGLTTLEEISFRQQVFNFRHTKLMVGVAGTAFHNLVFVPSMHQRKGEHGAVIFMQSAEWCPFAWMYSNQATILGSHVAVICPPNKTNAGLNRDNKHNSPDVVAAFSRRTMKQGSRLTKSVNITVDISGMFIPVMHMLHQATHHQQILLPIHQQHNSSVLEQQSQDIAFNFSLRAMTDVDVVVGEYDNSVEAPSLISAEDTSNYAHKVRLFPEIVGPRQEVQLLVDSRYFPFLSICQNFAMDKYVTCIPLEQLSYFADVRAALRSAELNVAHFLSFSSDTATFSIDVYSIPSSTTYFSGNIAFLLREKVNYVDLASFEASSLSLGPYEETEWTATRFSECKLRQDLSNSSENTVDVWFDPSIRLGILLYIQNYDCFGNISYITLKIPTKSLFWKHGQLWRDAVSQRVLQQRIGDVCERDGLDAMPCIRLASVIYQDIFRQHVMIPALSLPARQRKPTPQHPFVFLHMEKCAGTNIRSIVYDTAMKLQVEAFVPCYGNMSCFVFDLPIHQSPSVLMPLPPPVIRYLQHDLSNIAVLAGHFQWNIWQSLPACASALSTSVLSTADECAKSCFIMFRDPLERVVSQYYERIYSEKSSPYYQIPINDLSDELIEDLLLHYRWGRWREDGESIIVDEGFSDVYCRNLLGKKTTSGEMIYFDERDSRLDISPIIRDIDSIKLILERLDTCVVGLQDRWQDTLRVISHWFPWIEFTFEHANRRVHVTLTKEEKITQTLRLSIRELIEKHNQCDRFVYSWAVQRFETQLLVLEANGDVYFDSPDSPLP